MVKKKVLFVKPDYHSSFFLRDELRKLGWESDIFIDWTYPRDLLYEKKDVIGMRYFKNSNIFFKLINFLINLLSFCYKAAKYDFIIYYGELSIFPTLNILSKRHSSFCLELFYLKTILKKKIIFQPAGCHDQMLKEEFQRIDNGNVCNNCGFYDLCDDNKNRTHFERVRRYSDLNNNGFFFKSPQFKNSHFPFKSIDLNLWNSSIDIPKKYILPNSENFKIFHSSYLKRSNRDLNGENIKGTPFIYDAIKRLKNKGYKVELIYIDNVPSNKMRFYQAQADLVIDQLIYGHWGSSAIETMALGKPVICYLNNEWKSFLIKTLGVNEFLPIIEANTKNIYQILKNILDDSKILERYKEEGPKFISKFYDPKKNAKILQKKLLEL